MDNISKYLKKYKVFDEYDEFSWDDKDKLKCPICGFDYVHFDGEPRLDSGNDNGEAWAGRGDAVRIPLYCEEGHRWNVFYGFHKGQMYTAIEIVNPSTLYSPKKINDVR